MRQLIKITLAQLNAIHNANYGHDEGANKIIERLNRSYNYERTAIIPCTDTIIGEYTDYIDELLN